MGSRAGQTNRINPAVSLARRYALRPHLETNPVSIMETRPLSRLKRWRVVSIILKAVTTDAVAISEKDVAELVPTKVTKA